MGENQFFVAVNVSVGFVQQVVQIRAVLLLAVVVYHIVGLLTV